MVNSATIVLSAYVLERIWTRDACKRRLPKRAEGITRSNVAIHIGEGQGAVESVGKVAGGIGVGDSSECFVHAKAPEIVHI
jgi:hypothetical protein